MAHQQLSEAQIAQLTAQHCTAADWKQVWIVAGCDLTRIQRVQFAGTVRIGDLSGVKRVDGVERDCGISGAAIVQCDVGDRVRIANIGSVLSGYVIEDDVLIEDVGSLTTDAGAAFGNGVELETINEGGGRNVRILNDLTAQTAYLQGMLRHDPAFVARLTELVAAKAKQAISDRGCIASHASIVHCGIIRNVNVGPHAFIHGVQLLENGTANSCAEHPTEIGVGVQARSFILQEGARVDSGALLDKVFVGQSVKMGKQYSAENSLFFANCEAFHGEAVSLFAGPYTVTHHKSTLLIAGVFSFYNAGSGTNQSNHMYKLGPVHQGVLERGSKTGSFSYLLLEAHIGAFSVIIGKHYVNLNVPNLPFSYISEEEGTSKIVPAMNLIAVGTVRDGEKWPKRDGRKAPNKRDLIVFDVFSPYTVEKMRRGRDELLELSKTVSKERATVAYGGAQLSRVFLKKGAKYYAMAIHRYLYEKLFERVRMVMEQHRNWDSIAESLRPTSTLRAAGAWTDVAGLLMPVERLRAIEERVVGGAIATYDALVQEFRSVYQCYRPDEWQYVAETFEKEFGTQPGALTKEALLKAVDDWENAATTLQAAITEDSKKEFADFARISFGLDRTDEEKRHDFEAVRGTIETNSVVQKMAAETAVLRTRKEEFKKLIESIQY